MSNPLTSEQTLELIKNHESDRIELTESYTNTRKFGEAICAFANDLPNNKKNGYLLIGVDDKGNLTGFRATDRIKQEIAALRSDGNILPPPVMNVYSHTYPEGDIIVVDVQPSKSTPVRYNQTIWIRTGARKGKANEGEIRTLEEKSQHQRKTFDQRPCSETELEDLDLSLFEIFLARAMTLEELESDKREIKYKLSTWGFYNIKENLPTNAAILLFGKNTRQFFPGAYVQYVKFKGETKATDILKEKELTGNLLNIINQVESYIDTNIIEERPVPVSTFKEEKLKNFPNWALRELFLNAIMHSNYESNGPIRIYQFDDHLEILNHGGLYGDATPENFPHVNDYRNPILAQTLKILGYVNRFSRGVETAQKQLLENGNSEAEINLSLSNAFEVKVKEKKINVPASIESIIGGDVNGDDGDDNGDDESSKIIALIKARPGISTREIKSIFKDEIAPRTIDRRLKELKDQIIEYTGSSRKGGFFIKK